MLQVSNHWIRGFQWKRTLSWASARVWRCQFLKIENGPWTRLGSRSQQKQHISTPGCNLAKATWLYRKLFSWCQRSFPTNVALVLAKCLRQYHVTLSRLDQSSVVATDNRYNPWNLIKAKVKYLRVPTYCRIKIAPHYTINSHKVSDNAFVSMIKWGTECR